MDWLNYALPTGWLTYILPMEWLVYILPETQLIYLCEQAEARNTVINGVEGGNHVLRISDKIAVKRGFGVLPGEVATQKYAYQHLNCRVVRVPQVYRYFQVPDQIDPSWPEGYLFMEYIPGQTLEELELSSAVDITKRLADVVSELGKVTGTGDGIPGSPIGGRRLIGYLFGDEGTSEVISSVDDLNHWINKRLKFTNDTIDLRSYPLVLCHLDFCRRNIKLMEDNSICLLDWGHAGFFPRFYEVAAVSCYNDELPYIESLRQAIAKTMELSDREQECVKLLTRARALSLRYSL